MKKQTRNKKLILAGLAAPAIVLACAALTMWGTLIAHPIALCTVLSSGLLAGAVVAEFFSLRFMGTPVLILQMAAAYYFSQVFPWGLLYFFIFMGGVIGGLNFGLLSPKRFIIK